ncbi:cytochrome P450 305a1, partial [Asbolus verrucosus]
LFCVLGPQWLPLVGNLPQLKKLSKSLGGQHLALAKLAEEYNTNVLGLKLGNEYVVTVFSYPIVRDVLIGEEYEGRPDNFFLRLRCMGKKRGITCTDGELWSIQRNFVVRHLRNLGFGKKSMETMIRDEISEIVSTLKSHGSDIQINKILSPAVLNILWRLTTGTRLSQKNCQLGELLDLLNLRSKAFDMSGGTLGQHPWLRYVIPEWSGFNLIEKINNKLKNLFMESIRQHHKTWKEGRNDDLIHCFLSEMKQANGNPTSFTDDQLMMICLDLFVAGSQTTSGTLDFAFLMMIMHPEIQSKVQAQIDKHLGNHSILEYSDKYKIPYVEAVLLETQRYRHVVPVGGPRRVLRDTILDGYFIPENTTVLISFYSVHNDKKYWKDPEVFRPERFLDENGLLLSQEKLIPFGLGKRRCLGEALAKNCIFFFFVEIMRKYNVSLLSGCKSPTGMPLPGITLSPENYRAKFTER